jgi:cation-transporting ATPase E
MSAAPAEIRGLSEPEVVARRRRGLANYAPLRTSRSYFQLVRENVFTLVNNLLFGLCIGLVLLGQVSDAITSVAIVLINVAVGLFQEIRAKSTVDRIALLTRPKATVIREGAEREADPSEIVVGDALRARPGDQIVVDRQVIGAGKMQVDESLLSGESELIAKGPGDPVYSGSFCVAGTAVYEAQKVGTQSLANQITAGARAFRRIYTPVQRQIGGLIRILLLVALYLELLLVLTAALSATDIWATGYNVATIPPFGVPILRWDGAFWNRLPSPGGVSGTIAALADDDVWVGLSGRSGGASGPFSHWDGSRWTEVYSEVATSISGISAVSKDDIWATRNTQLRPELSPALHWDGVG